MRIKSLIPSLDNDIPVTVNYPQFAEFENTLRSLSSQKSRLFYLIISLRSIVPHYYEDQIDTSAAGYIFEHANRYTHFGQLNRAATISPDIALRCVSFRDSPMLLFSLHQPYTHVHLQPPMPSVRIVFYGLG